MKSIRKKKTWNKIDPEFWNNAEPIPFCGCFIWTKGTTREGYGQLTVNGKHVSAHRTAWELENGPIPKGLFILHRCDTPCCVNPNHLFLGDARDNIVDAYRKGRAKSRWSEMNYCARGHEFSAENTYRTRKGFRECRTCKNTRVRRKRAELKQAQLLSKDQNLM